MNHSVFVDDGWLDVGKLEVYVAGLLWDDDVFEKGGEEKEYGAGVMKIYRVKGRLSGGGCRAAEEDGIDGEGDGNDVYRR